MATKTRLELKTQALVYLGLVGEGQSAEAEYIERVEELVDPLLDQLSADSVCSIPDPETIPHEFFIPLAYLLANAAAPAFGLPFDPNKKAGFEAMLRRTAASRPSGEVLKTEYY